MYEGIFDNPQHRRRFYPPHLFLHRLKGIIRRAHGIHLPLAVSFVFGETAFRLENEWRNQYTPEI